MVIKNCTFVKFHVATSLSSEYPVQIGVIGEMRLGSHQFKATNSSIIHTTSASRTLEPSGGIAAELQGILALLCRGLGHFKFEFNKSDCGLFYSFN